MVELIVVFIILAILAAILLPTLTGYIDKANKKALLAECHSAVLAAQTLYSESYDSGTVVSIADIKALAEVAGELSAVQTNDFVVMHLTYSNGKYTVTYCRDYENCPLHDARYNFVEGGATENPEDPGAYENTVDYFYIAGDPNYKVYTWGDLSTYDPANGDEPGTTIPTGTIFYYDGAYYYTRWDQYLTGSTNLDQYLDNYGVSVDIDQFTTPNPETQAGDLKMVGGKVYVFFPMSSRYYEDYYSDDCWFEVTVD